MGEPKFAVKVGTHKRWQHIVLRTDNVAEQEFSEQMFKYQEDGFEICACTTLLDGRIVVFMKRPELPESELVEISHEEN